MIPQTGILGITYWALQALLNAVVDAGAALTPRPLEVALSGKNPNVRLQPLARRDVSFDVALWNAVSVYKAPVVTPDAKTITTPGADITDATVNDVLTFARKFRDAQVLRVNGGQAPTWSTLPTDISIPLPVGRSARASASCG